MAQGQKYEYHPAAWRDFDNEVHKGEPIDPQQTMGILVSVKNVDDPEDTHMFWAYDYGTFRNWAEWILYIEAIMEGHGMALA